MTTPTWIAGFEHGVATPVTSGGGLCDALVGGVTVSTDVANSGTYSLKIAMAAATAYLGRTVSGTLLVGRFYFRVSSWPDATVDLMAVTVAAGSSPRFRLEVTTHTLFASMGSGSGRQDYGTAIALDTWYRIDFRINVAATNNSTIDWQVNGAAQTQSLFAQTDTTLSVCRMGSSTAATGTFYIDDVILSATTGDYPIGPGATCLIKPDADGTHVNAANCIEYDDGTDVGTAWSRINSIPPDITQYLRVGTASAGKYAETTLGDMTAGKTPLGVMGCIAYTSATTSANNAGAVIMDGANERTIWGATGAYSDYSDGSTAALFYRSAIITVASISEANVNALKFRFISGDDANPDPYLIDVWAEVAYATAANYTLTAITQTYTETGVSLTALKAARLLTAAVRTYTETGVSLTKLTRNVPITAVLQTYAVSGVSLTKFGRTYYMTTTPRTYVESGANLTALLYTPSVPGGESKIPVFMAQYRQRVT